MIGWLLYQAATVLLELCYYDQGNSSLLRRSYLFLGPFSCGGWMSIVHPYLGYDNGPIFHLWLDKSTSRETCTTCRDYIIVVC